MTRTVDLGTAKLLPDVDRRAAWLLTVDDAPQSYVDLEDPRHLEFEYVRRLAHALDCLPPGPLELLHLGGGALTLPRYVAASRPESRQTVIERDGALWDLVRGCLPLPEPNPGTITVRIEDARRAVEERPARTVDVLVADVFSGARIPGELTNLSYVRAAARVLRPGGVYLANVADSAPFAFLASQLATLAEAFTELCVVVEPGVLRGRRYGNAVLLASEEDLPIAELSRRAAADPFPARVVHGSALDRLLAGAEPVLDGTEPAYSPAPPEGAFSIG